VPKAGAGYYYPLFERPDLIEDDYYRLRNQPHGWSPPDAKTAASLGRPMISPSSHYPPCRLIADVDMVGVILHGLRAVEGRVRNSEGFDRLVDLVADPSCNELAGPQRAGVAQLLVDLYYYRTRWRVIDRMPIYGRDIDGKTSGMAVGPGSGPGGTMTRASAMLAADVAAIGRQEAT
jgi:hypothetical protein